MILILCVNNEFSDNQKAAVWNYKLRFGFSVCSQLIGLVFKMVFSKIFDKFEENLMTISHPGILNCSK